MTFEFMYFEVKWYRNTWTKWTNIYWADIRISEAESFKDGLGKTFEQLKHSEETDT